MLIPSLISLRSVRHAAVRCTAFVVLARTRHTRVARHRAAAVALALALAVPAAAHADEWGLEVRDAADAGGAEIVAVSAGTLADLASLVAGDVVVQVQGRPVSGAAQYGQAVAAAASADPTIVVSRKGWVREVRLRAAAALAGFGLAVVARPAGGGAEIAAVAFGGTASAAGMQAGDIITAAAGRPVESAAALQQTLSDHAVRAQPLEVTVQRDNWSKQMTLAPRVPREAVAAAAPREIRVSAPTPAATSPPPPEPRAVVVPAARPEPVAPLAGEPGDVIADIGNANRMYDAGSWREAESYYQRVLRVMPDEASSWGRLCHAQVMQQRFGDAVSTCRSAAKFAAGEASVFQNLGFSQFHLGQYADSIVSYQRASQLAPEWAPPYSGAGASYSALNDWAKAEQSYRMAVARDAQDASAWQALGDMAGELGKPVDAIASYRKALALGPPTAELYRGLGWQLFNAGQLADAVTAFREANRLNPKDANTLVVLGNVADKLGRPAEAREAWQRALALEPSSQLGEIARYNLASLDARQNSARAAPIVMPAQPTRAAGASGRDDVKPPPAPAQEEPRAIVEPETDTGIK